MKTLAVFVLLTCVLSTARASEPTKQVRTFHLEGVRSGRLFGPFPFTTGTRIQLETGMFRLDVMSPAGNFILTDETSGKVFGVYELVPGRIIDAGYQLFTITRVATTSQPQPAMPAKPPATAPPLAYRPSAPTVTYAPTYQIGISADLVNQTAYEWTLDGQDGGSAKYVERRGLTLFATRGILTISAGLLADAQWNESIDDPAGRFEQGTLASGTGWTAGLQLLIPVWQEDRWSAAIGTGIQYQRESFDLEYGFRETILIETSPVTNDTPDALTNTTPSEVIAAERLVRQSSSATLTETWLQLNARIAYTAPSWFVYAGLRALPWIETDLSAAFEWEDQRIPLTFERRDPLSGFGGLGFTYQDLNAYAEFEAGGINSLRVGINLNF